MCVVFWAELLVRAGMMEWVLPAGWRYMPERGCSGTNQWLCVAMFLVTPLWQAPLLEEVGGSHIINTSWVNTFFSLWVCFSFSCWWCHLTCQFPSAFWAFVSKKMSSQGNEISNFCLRWIQVKGSAYISVRLCVWPVLPLILYLWYFLGSYSRSHWLAVERGSRPVPPGGGCITLVRRKSFNWSPPGATQREKAQDVWETGN